MTKKHGVLMMFLCLIPIIGIGAVVLFNIQVNTLVWVGLLILCPISHLLMMKSMHSESGHAISQETHATVED